MTFGYDASSTPTFPTLSLGYIATHLSRQRGIEIAIIDCLIQGERYREHRGNYTISGLPDDLLVKRLRSIDPDLVGITAMGTQSHGIYVETINRIKEVFPDLPVIVGGAHASVRYEQILRDCRADAVVIGEGEITFHEVCSRVGKGLGFEDVAGLALRNNGTIIRNPKRELVGNIDEFGFPDWELFDLERYFLNQKRWKGPYSFPAFNMLTSRGCPRDCSHCAFRLVWGKSGWRPNSPEAVLGEITRLVERYEAKEIHFLDDNLTYDPLRMERICSLLIDRGLKVRWLPYNGISHFNMNKQLLEKMKRSGCREIAFGFETGSPQVMEFNKKAFDKEQAIEVVREARKVGLWTVGYFIHGFPYEKSEDVLMTREFSVSVGVDFAVFNIMTPFPGTRVEAVLVEEGVYEEGNVPCAWDEGAKSLCSTKKQVCEQVVTSYRNFYRHKLRHFPLKRFIRIPRNTDEALDNWHAFAMYLRAILKWAVRNPEKLVEKVFLVKK